MILTQSAFAHKVNSHSRKFNCPHGTGDKQLIVRFMTLEVFGREINLRTASSASSTADLFIDLVGCDSHVLVLVALVKVDYAGERFNQLI